MSKKKSIARLERRIKLAQQQYDLMLARSRFVVKPSVLAVRQGLSR